MEIQPIFGVIKMELFVALVVIVVSILGYCIYLDRQSSKYWVKKYEEEQSLLKLRLETELLVPRSKIKIETFDSIFYSNYFTAILKPVMFSDNQLFTSKEIAQQSIQQSFKQGYFVTHDGIHIPVRVIKCAQIV